MDSFFVFERIVRNSKPLRSSENADVINSHIFDILGIHPKLPIRVRTLYDDSHFAESVFLAAKFLDKRISKLSGVKKTGVELMQNVFSANNPVFVFADVNTESGKNVQKGVMNLFCGLMEAIRNPLGHEFELAITKTECLDQLAFISMLMRKLETQGQQL